MKRTIFLFALFSVIGLAVPYAMLTGGNNDYVFAGCNLKVGL